MFNQYSYKVKFRFLLIFSVVLAITAYKRSYGNLFALFSENRELKERNIDVNKQKPNVRLLNQQIVALDKLIGKGDVEKDKIQREIVDFLVKNGSAVSIFDLQPVHEFQMEDYNIYTFQLDLTGSYNQLLTLMYHFEKQFDYSKIVSAKFYKEKRNNKIDILHLKLIFQNYENKK